MSSEHAEALAAAMLISSEFRKTSTILCLWIPQTIQPSCLMWDFFAEISSGAENSSFHEVPHITFSPLNHIPSLIFPLIALKKRKTLLPLSLALISFLFLAFRCNKIMLRSQEYHGSYSWLWFWWSRILHLFYHCTHGCTQDESISLNALLININGEKCLSS